jgi:putative ATP-dependent endonuclease of OLD family
MYLVNLKIQNYRSIRELDLSFKKGKNIIVGKNNSGKSNIVKAIDLVLGENAPAYYKYENVTLNDFHNGQTDQEILIWIQLQREANEALNYDEIYKAFGYKYHAERKWGAAVRHAVRTDSLNHFFEDLSALMNISEDEVPTGYVNPKLRNQQDFETQLGDKFQFGYSFRAYVHDSKVIKELRFFYREGNDTNWVMAFSASVRNELLQSAIIHSFRDPANELRINQWGWYGKLLRASINTESAELNAAFETLKGVTNTLFTQLHQELSESEIKIAFPGTTISFQFNPATKIDIYKSTLVYVDDGFNSLLQDKGSGIQSAVIIGLFDYYTRNVAHSSSSLLAVEEPELYLHPQARRVISNRLDAFVDGGRNQVIVTTHSSEFITTAHESLNIILARKTDNRTQASNTTFTTARERQLLVKTQNAEMFFADKVILVEGGDKYIFESICQFYGKTVNTTLGENWLNDKNFSVIAAGGKEEFSKYANKLNELKIPFIIIADFDFLLRGLTRYFTNTSQTALRDQHNGIIGQFGNLDPEIPAGLNENITQFIQAVEQNHLTASRSEILKTLKYGQKKKRLSQFTAAEQVILEAHRQTFQAQNIYILSGELEDNFTAACREGIAGISGKEEKTIHIVANLVTDEHPINEFVEIAQYVPIIEALTA